jgi:copper chaperone
VRTEILNVKGMTCGGCTSAVTKALQATQGVEDVAVDLGNGQATIRFDDGAASIDDLRSAVARAGFEVVDGSAPSKSGGCCGNG